MFEKLLSDVKVLTEIELYSLFINKTECHVIIFVNYFLYFSYGA